MCPENLQARLHSESVSANGTKLGAFRILSIYAATRGAKGISGHPRPSDGFLFTC